MVTSKFRRMFVAAWACSLFGISPLMAQEAPNGPKFAKPVRIKSGAKFLGEGRLYPSPVFADMDGDKASEMVIGDLPGRVTIAKRIVDDQGVRLTAEKKLMDADGNRLNFRNW